MKRVRIVKRIEYLGQQQIHPPRSINKLTDGQPQKQQLHVQFPRTRTPMPWGSGDPGTTGAKMMEQFVSCFPEIWIWPTMSKIWNYLRIWVWFTLKSVCVTNSRRDGSRRPITRPKPGLLAQEWETAGQSRLKTRGYAILRYVLDNDLDESRQCQQAEMPKMLQYHMMCIKDACIIYDICCTVGIYMAEGLESAHVRMQSPKCAQGLCLKMR